LREKNELVKGEISSLGKSKKLEFLQNYCQGSFSSLRNIEEIKSLVLNGWRKIIFLIKEHKNVCFVKIRQAKEVFLP
jgi:hypothetical protein